MPTDGTSHIDGISITVTAVRTGAPTGSPAPAQSSVTITATCSPPSNGTVECDAAWPTELEHNGYVVNGLYQVSATARTCPNSPLLQLQCSTMGSGSGTLTVSHAPTPPANVKAVLTSDGHGVVVTWTGSPEPDVFGYEVRRLGSDTRFFCQTAFAPPDFIAAPICQEQLSITDPDPGGGDFKYEVFAVRFGGAGYDAKVNATTSSTQSNVQHVDGPVTPTLPNPTGSPGTRPGPALPTFGVFSAKPPAAAKPGGTTAGGGFNSKPSPAPAVGGTPNTVDPGFEATLPYQQLPGTGTTLDPAVVGPRNPAAKGRPSSNTSIALTGAGLLVSVIAMHGLWLRNEVKRSGVLEVLEPEH